MMKVLPKAIALILIITYVMIFVYDFATSVTTTIIFFVIGGIFGATAIEVFNITDSYWKIKYNNLLKKQLRRNKNEIQNSKKN